MSGVGRHAFRGALGSTHLPHRNHRHLERLIMKEMKKPAHEHPDSREGDRGHIVHFRLSDPDYRTLAGLARYHGTSIARLITGALPLVIEKYRVLRALQVPPDAHVTWRRGGRSQG